MESKLNGVISFFKQNFDTLIYKKDVQYSEIDLSNNLEKASLLFFDKTVYGKNQNPNSSYTEIFSNSYVKRPPPPGKTGGSGAPTHILNIFNKCILEKNISKTCTYLEELVTYSTYYKFASENNHSFPFYGKSSKITSLDKIIKITKEKYEVQFDILYAKEIEKIMSFLQNHKVLFLQYNVDINKLNRTTVFYFLTVLIAVMLHSVTIDQGYKKEEYDAEKKKLEKEITRFIRENNLGSGKLTHDDFLYFSYVEPKDTDKTKFKKINEFLITPTLELNNNNRTFRCLLEGNSGVGKTTLLKAITNIFVIENTDTAEFDESEKLWYTELKTKIFTDHTKTYLPVFIEAKNTNDFSSDFDFLSLAYGYEKSLLENIVSCNDNVLFLIDGIEEVEETKRKLFEKAFTKYSKDHTNINVIVTTRYSGSFECVNEKNGYTKNTLQKLNFDSIYAYVKNSAIIENNQRDNILSFLKNEEIKDFVCNPFMFERLVQASSERITIYKYLESITNSIIERRWGLTGDFTKLLLGYVATIGNSFKLIDFKRLIRKREIPKSLSADLEDYREEYDIFKEQWTSKSGILSYTKDNKGEFVSFEESLSRAYLASLYIEHWFKSVRNDEEICPMSRNRKNINYYDYLDLIKLIDKTFDLTDDNILRAILLILSNEVDKFKDPILTISIFLKYLSISNGESGRTNIKNFFESLKNKNFGDNLVTNFGKASAQIMMRNIIDYVLADFSKGESYEKN